MSHTVRDWWQTSLDHCKAVSNRKGTLGCMCHNYQVLILATSLKDALCEVLSRHFKCIKTAELIPPVCGARIFGILMIVQTFICVAICCYKDGIAFGVPVRVDKCSICASEYGIVVSTSCLPAFTEPQLPECLVLLR